MGHASYVERPPVPALADRVQSVWCLRVSESASHTQRIVPDGCTDVISYDGHLLVAGPDTSYRLADMRPGLLTVGIRFRTGTAGVLFGDMPVSAVRDEQPLLGDLWGDRTASELAERLATTDSPSHVLQDAVVARLSRVDAVDPVVVAAVGLFDTDRPPSVTDVAGRFGLSERHFRRRFVHAVGYGPSTLVGVLRLGRTMRLLETRARATEIAAVAGYADQPHMTRELRRLAGVTPGQLRR
ncbi:MAG TPA: AraC family transcriptional regulator [Pseudonocardiaceae bacterium]|nr:AraC family transcriptional regulator [Pseudonocardiaceae bacterium]